MAMVTTNGHLAIQAVAQHPTPARERPAALQYWLLHLPMMRNLLILLSHLGHYYSPDLRRAAEALRRHIARVSTAAKLTGWSSQTLNGSFIMQSARFRSQSRSSTTCRACHCSSHCTWIIVLNGMCNIFIIVSLLVSGHEIRYLQIADYCWVGEKDALQSVQTT